MPTHEGVTCGGRSLVAKTCSTCGELKTSEHFRRDRRGPGDGYWQSQCKECQYIAAKNAMGRDLGAPTRQYHQWFPEEIKQLRQLLYEGKSYAKIAKILGRTLASVNGAEKRYMVKGWRDNVQQLQREAS